MPAPTILDPAYDPLATSKRRAGKTLGPKQARDAKREAEMVYLWSLDLTAAVEAGDVEKITLLTSCMARTIERIDGIAGRAK